MALVTMLSYSMIDDAGKRDTVRVFLPANTSLADCQTFSDTFAADLDAVTGAVIESAAVSLALTLPGGLKVTAVADSFKQVGANWGCGAANTNYRHTVRVPAINPSLLVDGQVDVAAQDIIDFGVDLTAGVGAIDPCDEYGNDLDSIIEVSPSFRTK